MKSVGSSRRDDRWHAASRTELTFVYVSGLTGERRPWQGFPTSNHSKAAEAGAIQDGAALLDQTLFERGLVAGFKE